MGKSPGKWIKTILFGKKYSKSNLSKDGAQRASYKAPTKDLAVTSPVISDPIPQTIVLAGKTTEPEEGTTTCSGLPSHTPVLSPVVQGPDSQGITQLISSDGPEIARQELAATKAQAAFRGYLARRAFRALRGIIRLQALIRGHLVRRQAVATLRCMHAIVRFQALSRGRKTRLSGMGYKVLRKFRLGELQDAKDSYGVKTLLQSGKLAKSSFACKLVVSVPTAMPLSLQYESTEPNSAWNWLERWSLSHFWEPLPRAKIVDATSQRKQASMQIGETEASKPKRSVRKVPTVASGDNGVLNFSENEKPKRLIRKVNHQIESAQENPQSELEKVKRNLRKVSAAVAATYEKTETETKIDQNLTKISDPPIVTSEQETITSLEKVSDSAVEVAELPAVEPPSKPLTVDEPIDVKHEDSAVDHCPVENGSTVETYPTVNDERSPQEDQTSKENQKTRRRKSLPAKQEYPENDSQNTPSLPSYMAATESAKAKLRGQGSPRFVEEGVENGPLRRHSLPSSTNGKLSSLSPRVQKPVQANGKGGSKGNRSLSSSRDDKVLQPGWRR